MDETIEQRMHRLSRCSLTEELANLPDDFGWWIVANYGEHLLFQSDPSKEADAVKYATQLAEFCSWDYHGALHQVRENYLM